MSDLELAVAVSLEIGTADQVAALARKHAGGYAFTFGAMGSTKTNFYSAAFERQGFGAQIARVHELWQSGDKAAAEAAVPPEIGLGTNLVGTEQMVAEQIAAYRAAGVDLLRVSLTGDTTDDKLRSLGAQIERVQD